MIRAMIWLGWTNLKRDRVALFLTFLLPLVFFSIFASIFGGMGSGGGSVSAKAMKVLAVDEDGSSISAKLLAQLGTQDGLDVIAEQAADDEGGVATLWTRETAFLEVRGGRATAAVVVPSGFSEQFANFADLASADASAVEVIYDASNPMAQYTITGLLQAAAFQAAPDLLMERGFEALEGFGGGDLTAAQREALSAVRAQISTSAAAGEAEGDAGFQGLVSIEATAAHDDSEDSDSKFSMVAYYAAGIGVMFLLFSMTGAAGTLLDDQDSGTLERLLSSNLSVNQLLGGRWLFFALVGFLQVLTMFVWGALAFGLELFTLKRVVGLLVMAAVTAAAAAAFALLLATLCKSRAQLGGLSTIVILVMSALGGSMVPRFVMPDFMDTLSKATFNGWALDGFLKVFWYDDPTAGLAASLLDLGPQGAVLSLAAAAFLFGARRLASRWERT